MKKSILFVIFALKYSLFSVLGQTTTPILLLNTDMHTAAIRAISADSSGKVILTCSHDKTAKLWEAQSGRLIKTFRMPIDDGNEGMLYACAISPDGKTAVCGGWTGYKWDTILSLYIFDVPSNKMTHRIIGLPEVILDIEFSKNGNYMVATTAGNNGVGIFETKTWTLIKSFSDYEADCYSAVFDNYNRMATACDDGKIRLYSSDFELIEKKKTTGGKFPRSLAFSPNGNSLAVAYEDSYKIQVLDGKTLKLLYEPDVKGTENDSDHLDCVTFSYDGQYLIAGGTYAKSTDSTQWHPIRKWEDKGKIAGLYFDYPVSQNTILDITTLPDNSIIFCSGNPDFGRIKTDGSLLFKTSSETNIYAAVNKSHFKINNDGSVIGVTSFNKKAVTFSVKDRLLSETNFSTVKPYKDNFFFIKISDWNDSHNPKINSKNTNILKEGEMNYSVDIADDNKKIIFGTSWNIYCVNGVGSTLWSVPVQSSAWCVNISDNGKVVAAALGDGTIRWYNMDDGTLLFSLFLHPDNKRWILWSPKGYFDCSQGADDLIGWHVNQGPEKEALYYPASQFFEKFYIPNLGARILAGEEITSSDVNITSFKLPPLVKITSPTADIRGITISKNILQSEHQTVEVNIEVTDQGGGIDEILLYHNGKLAQTTNKEFKPLGQKNEKLIKSFTISLTNGDNKIKATAFNTQRTEAISDEIVINYNGTQSSKPDLYMMIIGINEYKNTRYNLNYALADATSFKDAMLAGSSEIFSKVNTVFIKNAEATKNRIIEELSKIKGQAKQEDVFILYYAGHGAMSEEEKSLFYLILTDVTQMFSTENMQEKAISASELKQFSTEIKAQKQIFLLDACQSGGMENVIAARGAAEEKAIAQLARSTGTYWLAAANSDQFAGEFSQLEHGLFTYCVLQAFTGKADGQNDKKVTVQELSSYLNDQVPILSKQFKGSVQYPVTYSFGQDFPIIIVK